MTAELNRKTANLIKEGTVSQTDPAANRVRVKHGELETDWLPYAVPFAGGVSVHRLPSVGEYCAVISPSGDTAGGLVLCGIASDRFPAPSTDPADTIVKFPDGGVIRYNHNSGAMVLKAISSLTIDTPETTVTGNLTVKKQTTSQGLLTYQNGMTGTGGAGGATNISGNINHTGTLSNSGDITANGISLSSHTHPGDSGGTTGAPK